MIQVRLHCTINSNSILNRRIQYLSTKVSYVRPIILGLETSCDDTGAAVIDGMGHIRGESLHSQTKMTVMLGGVVPPVAAQLHTDNIDRVVSTALKQAKIHWSDLDAIALTTEPGMALSLHVGKTFALHKAEEHKLPIIPVHHMKAHALTARMMHKIEFPYLCLLVSGGHGIITLCRSVDDFDIIGQSLDIAPGELFDKAARRMKLSNLGPPYDQISGGQAIENLALKGDPKAFDFGPPRAKHRDCNLSFSGLLSQTRVYVTQEEEKHGCSPDEVIPSLSHLCASIQYAVAYTLCRRLQRAMRYLDWKEMMPQQIEKRTLVISGGVGSNLFIRSCMDKVCSLSDYQLLCPPPHLCTDNGVMIAWNGLELHRQNSKLIISDLSKVDYSPRSPLGPDHTEDVLSYSIKLERLKLLC